MQWLTQTLVASLYPGAPYERKYLAVLLLDTLLEVWNSPDAGCKSYIRLEGRQQSLPASNAGLLLVGQHRFKAFCDGFFEAKTSKLLLGRDLSCRLFLKLPKSCSCADLCKSVITHCHICLVPLF